MPSHVSFVPPPQKLDRRCKDLAGSALFQWCNLDELTGHNAKPDGTGDSQEITYFRIHHFDLCNRYSTELREASRLTMQLLGVAALPTTLRWGAWRQAAAPGRVYLDALWNDIPRACVEIEYSTQRIILSRFKYCIRYLY